MRTPPVTNPRSRGFSFAPLRVPLLPFWPLAVDSPSSASPESASASSGRPTTPTASSASADEADPAGDESALTRLLPRPVARAAPSVLALGRGLAVVGVSGIGVGVLAQSDHTDGELDRGVLGSVAHGVAGEVDDDLSNLRFGSADHRHRLCVLTVESDEADVAVRGLR